MESLTAETNRTRWWLLRSRLAPYVAFAIITFVAVWSWRVGVTSNARSVATLEELAGWDARGLGYDATPFIEAVAAQVRVVQDQRLVLVISLAVVAFLVIREITLIEKDLWGRKNREATAGSARPKVPSQVGWLVLFLAAVLLIGALPAVVSSLLSPDVTSLQMTVLRAPKPVSEFGGQFFSLTLPIRMFNLNSFLIPFFGLMVVYFPLATLRQHIRAALAAGILKTNPL